MDLKEKNLLDLRYHTNLNYFNIFVIFISTSFITLVIGISDYWTASKIMYFGSILLLLIGVLWLLLEDNLSKVRSNIRKL